MLPAPILRRRKREFGGDVEVESWLVESRSLAGMSGSPVFWYILADHEWQARPGTAPQIGAPGIRQALRGPMLLGIDWGHPPVYDRVVDGKGKAHPDGWQVPSNSGFMAVAPAQKLVELLDSEEAATGRNELGG
jgi:hypothetical protein